MNVKNSLVNRNIIEIFKTNVNNRQLANKIVYELNQLYPKYRINFDLEDRDKVLRVESYTSIDVLGIINFGKLNNPEIKLLGY